MNKLLQLSLAAMLIALSGAALTACDTSEQAEEVESEEEEDD